MTSYINSRRRGTLSKKRRFTKKQKRRSRKYAMRGGTKIKIEKNYPAGTYYGEVNDRNQRNGKGTFTFSDGRIYDGDWKDDKMNDVMGKYTWHNRDVYEGQFVDNMKRGRGTYNFADGRKYEGEWKDDKRNGKGTLTFPDRRKYVGEWKDDQRHGKGTFTFPDGRIYDGEWKDDQRRGKGTFIFADGRKYVGNYTDDQMDGDGNMTWSNGDKYVGQWKNDMRNGSGIMTWHKLGKYVGEWKDNKEHGEGKHYYPDGETTYEGKFEFGEFSGLGVYTKKTLGYVFEYRGNHENGFRHGDGIITTRKYDVTRDITKKMDVKYENEKMISGKGERIEHDGTIEDGDFVNTYFIKGTQTKPSGTIDTGHFKNSIIKEGTRISSNGEYTYEYVGGFKDGKPRGRGSMRYMDESTGWTYEGMFKGGKRDGPGKFIFDNGQIYEGTFEDDMPLVDGKVPTIIIDESTLYKYMLDNSKIPKMSPTHHMSAEQGMSKQIFYNIMTLKPAARRKASLTTERNSHVRQSTDLVPLRTGATYAPLGLSAAYDARGDTNDTHAERSPLAGEVAGVSDVFFWQRRREAGKSTEAGVGAGGG